VKLGLQHSGGIQTEGVCEQGAEEKFGPASDEVMGEWRKMHKEELCD
jgi:hypothetical protein